MDRLKWVQKGWGGESWIVNKSEYCGKLLFFKKGLHCSFHYHKLKTETFYCHSGRILLIHSMEDCFVDGKIRIESLLCPPKYLHSETYGNRAWLDATLENVGEAKMTVLEPGDTFYIPVGLRHAMLGLLDTELFEFSTEHFDEDSYRILKGD